MPTSRFAIALAAMVAPAVLLAGAAGPLAQHLMVRQLERDFAQLPLSKAKHGAIRYSLWQGRLEIDGRALESAAPTQRVLKLDHLEADGVGPAYLFGTSNGELRLAALRLRQVQFEGDGLSGSMESLTIEEPRFAAGATPADYEAMLRQFAARRLSATQAQFRTEAPRGELAFANAEGEGLKDGRFEKLAFRELAFVAAGETGRLRAELAAADLSGVDYGCWRNAALADPDEMLPLIDRMSGSGMAITGPAGRLTAETLSYAGFMARARLVARPAPAPSAWLAGTSIDAMEMTAAVFIPAGNPAARASFAHFALQKFQPGRLGALKIDQVAISGPEGVGKLATLELSDLRYGGDGTSLGIGRLRLDALSAGLKAGAEISLKEALFTTQGPAARPLGADIELSGVTIPATAVPLLMRAGYNELTLDYEGHSHYDSEQATIDASQRLSAHGAGTLSIAMHLSNYPGGFDWRESMQAMLKFMALRLDRLELRYDDASLIERLIKMRAAETGRDFEAVRDELLRSFAAQRQALAERPALSANFDAVADFLRKPGSLTLTLAPPEPVSLGTLMTLSRTNPAAALDALGLSIR
jgi:hypothetical protein